MMMAARHSVIRFASLSRDTRTGKHQRAAIHDHHSEEMRGVDGETLLNGRSTTQDPSPLPHLHIMSPYPPIFPFRKPQHMTRCQVRWSDGAHRYVPEIHGWASTVGQP